MGGEEAVESLAVLVVHLAIEEDPTCAGEVSLTLDVYACRRARTHQFSAAIARGQLSAHGKSAHSRLTEKDLLGGADEARLGVGRGVEDLARVFGSGSDHDKAECEGKREVEERAARSAHPPKRATGRVCSHVEDPGTCRMRMISWMHGLRRLHRTYETVANGFAHAARPNERDCQLGSQLTTCSCSQRM